MNHTFRVSTKKYCELEFEHAFDVEDTLAK